MLPKFLSLLGLMGKQTQEPFRNGTSHRCRGCISEAGRETLGRIETEIGNLRVLEQPGQCGKCGRIGGVIDLPHLIALRYRGLISVVSPTSDQPITHRTINPRGMQDAFMPYYINQKGTVVDDLIAEPMQQFLDPRTGDRAAKSRLMTFLGTAANSALEGEKRPALTFTDTLDLGACGDMDRSHGPAALAAMTGVTAAIAADNLPRFLDYGLTTEVMMALGLYQMDRRFSWKEHAGEEMTEVWPEFGIIRVGFEGPWSLEGDTLATLRRSHWIATARRPNGEREVFDVNSISKGGWVSQEEWSYDVAPEIAKKFGSSGNASWRTLDTFNLKPATAVS